MERNKSAIQGPSVTLALKIARVFDVPVEDIFYYEEGDWRLWKQKMKILIWKQIQIWLIVRNMKKQPFVLEIFHQMIGDDSKNHLGTNRFNVGNQKYLIQTGIGNINVVIVFSSWWKNIHRKNAEAFMTSIFRMSGLPPVMKGNAI